MSPDHRQIAIKTFEAIQQRFPHIAMYQEDPSYCDIELYIPKQDSLDFTVRLNLQNTDGLYLMVDPIWGEWYPCTNPSRVEEYIAVVSGILQGTYRIEVHTRRNEAFKCLIQKPEGDTWQTVFTWRNLTWPWGKSTVYHIQNQSNP